MLQLADTTATRDVAFDLNFLPFGFRGRINFWVHEKLVLSPIFWFSKFLPFPSSVLLLYFFIYLSCAEPLKPAQWKVWILVLDTNIFG
jgi:hypothetical protein